MKVFVLEDDPDRIRLFAEVLEGHDWTCIHTCDRTYEFHAHSPYDLILLDHDLGGRQMVDHEDSGTEFVKLVRDHIGSKARVTIHSYNPDGARRMSKLLEEVGVFPVIQPFGPTLLKDIRTLLEKEAPCTT